MALLLLSVVLWAALALCYAVRPDAAAAVTLWPAWVWPAPGLLLALAAWPRATRRVFWALAGCWLLFVLVFAEEPRSLVRVGAWPAPGWEAARQRGEALRVVALNCAGGSEAAAAEVAAYRPDMVIWDEAPGREEVERLARQLFGPEAGVAFGLDAVVAARGRVRARPVAPSARLMLTSADVRLATGREVTVMGLRLVPPTVRIDLWSLNCWREQADNRRARFEQAQEIAREIARLPAEAPLIVGGDFNAPAGDRIYRLLSPRLHDTFREGGRGWGNTALNDFPFARIDQIWVSDEFRAVAVVARQTQNSDHRMVVCDLVWRGALR